mmetsp:Transcript_18299/g.28528  ORF Transcript_18299/g.28528 Transcript_18299/m.28528 type:complete len:824 (-) Transcript_18299:2149-4620(-)
MTEVEPDINALKISANAAAAQDDNTPANAGEVGSVEVWRIEDFEKVPLPPDECGQFFDGDSYVILYTYTKPPSTTKEYIIYFWQGNYSTQDEEGASALHATELDEKLGGTPVQVRVTQGKEPQHFRAIFHGCMVIHAGGKASGFKNVDAEDEEDTDGIALYHVYGTNSENTYGIHAEEKAASLTSRDCFCLAYGKTVYLWIGKGSNDAEEMAASKIAEILKKKLYCRKIEKVKEGKEPARFWKGLGGKGDYPKERHSQYELARPRLFHCSNFTGFLQVEEILDFAQSDLNDDDVMILDAGVALYLWIGAGANEQEKLKAVETAKEYVADAETKLTKKASIVTIQSGKEPACFTQYFAGWEDEFFERNKWVDPVAKMEEEAKAAAAEAKDDLPLEPTTAYAKAVFAEKDKAIDHDKPVINPEAYYDLTHGKDDGKPRKSYEIDYAALHEKKVSETEDLVDDGNGKIEVWRIEDFQKVPVPKETYGQFYDGDSYIVLYTYTEPNSTTEKYIIYFWQGNHSSQDEKGASAIFTAVADEELGGLPIQVRVTQGKEPRHFRKIFKGAMIIRYGGVASGFNNTDEVDTIDTDNVELYHVYGKSDDVTMGVYVEEKAASLTSRDCFVLLCKRRTTLWVGSGSTEGEVAAAAKIAAIVSNGKMVSKVREGKEPASFWKALGGKGEYAKGRQATFALEDPRLFKCSDAIGAFSISEITPFAQEDLDDDDVMMLDTGGNVFVWVGKGANQDEREKSMESAAKYIDASPHRKNKDKSIIVQCFSGEEPSVFTQFFPGWDPTLLEKTKFVDPYQKKLQAEKEAAAAAAAASWWWQ